MTGDTGDDCSPDIPEVGEDWFRKARLVLPKERPLRHLTADELVLQELGLMRQWMREFAGGKDTASIWVQLNEIDAEREQRRRRGTK